MLNRSLADFLVLSRRIQMEIVQHACAALPAEAVGIMGGLPGEKVETVLPLPNIAGEQKFLAEPYAQYKAFAQLQKHGYELRAIYHSHPGGGTEPSASDIAWGSAWPCAHLIVALPLAGSVAQHSNPRLKAWRFGPGIGECAAVRLIIED